MALPAVAGKFGVRGGGFSMSNSQRLGHQVSGVDERHARSRRHALVNMNHLGRALLDYDDPPVQMLFVYNCNPLATMPDQNRVLRGTAARRPVHGRLRAGLHRHRALRRRRAAGDDVPRELRHRQGLRPDQPAAGAAGHRAARRGAAQRRGVLGAGQRLGVGEAEDETETLLPRHGPLPAGTSARTCWSTASPRRPTAARRSSSSTSFR